MNVIGNFILAFLPIILFLIGSGTMTQGWGNYNKFERELIFCACSTGTIIIAGYSFYSFRKNKDVSNFGTWTKRIIATGTYLSVIMAVIDSGILISKITPYIQKQIN